MPIKLGSDFDYLVEQEVKVLKIADNKKRQQAMPKPMLERDIESRVCAYAKSKGWLVYKFTSPSRAAVPDRIFISPQGRVLFCEFKKTGVKPTAAQCREHDRLRAQKVPVYVVDSVVGGQVMVDLC